MLSKPVIIVGTDLSFQADEALKAGEAIRKKTNGELFVIHVSPFPYEHAWLNNDLFLNYLPVNYKVEVEKSLNSALAKQVKRCEIECSSKVIFGSTYKGLHECIDSQKADLLIMGHKGESSEHFLGSVTAKMVASAHIPVLVTKKAFSPKKIAGLIESADPIKSIFAAAEEISFLFSSELQFISVWMDVSHQFVSRSLAPSFDQTLFTEEHRNGVLVSMEAMIKENMDTHSKARINTKLAKEKSIGDSLLKIMEQENIDLAVVARHQKNLIEKLLIGSVSRRLLDSFQGNLLILPPR